MGTGTVAAAAEESATCEKVISLLQENASVRRVLRETLQFCSEVRTPEEADVFMAPLMPAGSVFTPVVLRNWLKDAGGMRHFDALAEAVPASDPQPGAGDSDVEAQPHEWRWKTTPAGLVALEALAPARLFGGLLEAEAEYREVYLKVLDYCREEPRTKAEVEELLLDHPALQKPRVFAAYFTNELEEVGAIEWNGRWTTSETGALALES